MAHGGVGQYGWTVASGALPTGLTLAPLTGIISGTPSATGTFYFELRVTDVPPVPVCHVAVVTPGFEKS